MSETTTIDLRAIFASLPERIKDVFVAPETSAIYDSITKKFQLNADQREAISAETGFLLLGLRNPQELVTALTTALQIEREKASLIAQDLNRDLFYAIKDELKSLYATNDATTVQSTPATQTANPVVPPTSFSFTKAVEGSPSVPAVNIPSAPTTSSVPTVPTATLEPKPAMPIPHPQIESPKAHVGNIFEEKLGGAFRVKSDAVEYSAPQEPSSIPPATPIPTTPQPIPQVSAIPPSIPVSPVVPPPLPTIPQATPNPVPPIAPVSPLGTATQKPADPYRELPM